MRALSCQSSFLILISAICLHSYLFASLSDALSTKLWLSCGSDSLMFGCIMKSKRIAATRRGFDRINNYLESNVKSEEVSLNMEAIDKWIELESKRQGSDVDLLRALDIFRELGLQEAPQDSSRVCSKLTYDTLLANDRAMRGVLGQLRNDQEPKRRIERILVHYAQMHSRRCNKFYEAEYERSIKLVDKQRMEPVRKLIESFVEWRADAKRDSLLKNYKVKSGEQFIREYTIEASNFVDSIKAFTHWRDIELVLKQLKDASELHGRPGPVRVLQRSRSLGSSAFMDTLHVGMLINEQIMQPCAEFVHQLESALSNNLSLIKTSEISDEERRAKGQFYRDSILFKGCQKFMLSAAVVANELRNSLHRSPAPGAFRF